VDSGPILNQAEEIIFEDDTIAELYSRIEILGIRLLYETLPLLALGVASSYEQDHFKRRSFPQRSPNDGKIDWKKNATFINRFIRAQTRPYPGAFTLLDGNKLVIWASIYSPITYLTPGGKIAETESGYSVSCEGGGSIILKEVEYKGRLYFLNDMSEMLADVKLLLGDGVDEL
jgi:methionyl-tRNA formyltransferase